jgi:homoserine dehydrogenase
MKSFREFLDEGKITQADLNQIEKYADKLFAKVNVDIEFTRHFLDRINDPRNKKQINSAELIRLWRETYKKYGKKIPKLGDHAQAVLQDMETDINVPFVLNWKNGEFELVSKTIMRKKNFTTPNQKLRV